MGQLIEIIFEALEKDQAIKVYEHIAGIKDSDERDLNSLIVDSEAHCIDTALDSLALNPETIINNVRIRLLKYDNLKYDVEINFDLSDITTKGTMRIEAALFDYSSNIANQNLIANYFAGLEPANDEETRFFTKDKMGPYSLPK